MSTADFNIKQSDWKITLKFLILPTICIPHLSFKFI